MQWKDSEETIDAEDEEAEAYYEEEYSPLGGKNAGITSRVTQKAGWPMILWVPLGVILLILVYVLLPGGGTSAGKDQLDALEKRVELLEKRMLKIESLGERVSNLEKGVKGDASLSKRFERFEAAMGKRMDQVDKELIKIGKTVNAKKTKTVSVEPAQKKKTSDSKAQYHIVKKGETLYSISRRYGISVDRLRANNQLGQKTAIFTGQKLKVK